MQAPRIRSRQPASRTPLKQICNMRLPVIFVLVLSGLCADARAQTPPKKPRLMWEEADAYYQAHGQFGKARVVLENVRAHLRAQNRGRSVEYINPSGRLAKICSRMGDFDQSSSIYDELTEVCGERFGPESIEVARVRLGQAIVLFWAKRYALAETKAREGLALLRGDSLPVEVERAHLHEILGPIRGAQHDFVEAEASLNETLSIFQRRFGPDDLRTCTAWVNLAQVYLEHGRVAQAQEAFRRGNQSSVLSPGRASLNDMEYYRTAAILALSEDNRELAREYADRLFAAQSLLLRDAFPGMSREERLQAKAQFDLVGLYATLGDAEQIARVVLETKAVSLEDWKSARTGPATVPVFDELLVLANAERGLQPADPALVAEMAKGDPGTVGPSPPPRAEFQTVSTSDVIHALPRGSVVVEWVRYQANLSEQSELRYGALVFSQASTGSRVRWVDLGAASPLEDRLRRWETTIRDPMARLVAASALRDLYQSVWSGIEAVLPEETRTIYLAPDAALCFVPFPALLDRTDRFLCERFRLLQTTATRELFHPGRTAANWVSMGIVADPTFAAEDSAGEIGEKMVSRRTRGRLLEGLPGAKREAEVLRTLAGDQGLKVVSLLGRAATEEAVRGLPTPGIVHFGTHGLYVPSSNRTDSRRGMDRSALALSGAQHSLDALQPGDSFLFARNDGVLTAREAMSLPWSGTWLVTLAACDTGMGEAQDGESVLGLRRAFVAAGVQNVVYSLWPVADEAAVSFMADFYREAFRTRDVPRALTETQRRWLLRLRREQGLSPAVAAVGGYAINVTAFERAE